MAKWSRRKARARGSASASWREVTPSVRAGRLGLARSCAAGAVVATIAVVAWGVLVQPDLRNLSDPHGPDAMVNTLSRQVSIVASWAFLLAALGWHFGVEQRRRPGAPARLSGDGWLVILVMLVGGLGVAAPWPFPTVVLDEAAGAFVSHPPAAAADAVVGIAVAACLAVVGVLVVTVRAEKRDAASAQARKRGRELASTA